MPVDARTQGTISRVTPAERHVPSTSSPVVEIDADGTKKWMVNGVLHREDGPAVERPSGTKLWYRHGQLHREDGPANERADGTKEWYRHDRLHREDGPAVEYANGGKAWWLNGQHHREDGPANEYADGSKSWYLHNQWYPRHMWLREVLKDRPLTTHQREFLNALIENWDGTPDLLYTTVTHLAT